MDRRFILTAGVAAVAAGGAYLTTRPSQSTGPGLGAVNAQEAADIDTSAIVDMTVGSPDAPVTMIEYASLTCPHCANFHENVYPSLKRDYIDTGKVQFIFREVYFDRFGLWGAMIARCGGELRYFGLIDVMFQEQRDWLAGGDPTGVVQNLRAIGRRAGITDDELTACLEDTDTAQAMIARYQETATADDINSTPSFVINGTKYGNMSYGDLKGVLDGELG
ncbi:DsbA family protein [Cochlodiniinecator piscidefendens]|uniref:DsbA family protein n=1 Tax=Cochlodiniinecator piscidefendens TaxID=2715756 RepID=UPI00140AA290|nr:DsbA family protein [Cochlodiniinecator piscidefendens]